MKRLLASVFGLLLVAVSCGGDDGGSAGGDSVEDWCTLGREVIDGGDALDDVDPFDPESVRVAFEELGTVLDRARAAAPEEIRADVDATADAFSELRAALDEADYDLFAVDESALAGLEDEALDASAERIEEYNRRVCGFDQDNDDDTDAGTDDGAEDDGAASGASSGGSTDDAATGGATTGGATELSGLEAMVVDQIVTSLEAEGFTTDEARCIAESYDIEALMAGALDPDADVDLDIEASAFDAFERCDISIQRLAEIGG